MLSEPGWCGEALATLATAIDFRLTALAHLLSAKGTASLSSDRIVTVSIWTHAELVQCAAEEPLIDRDDQPTFNAGSFERRLLAMTAARGRV